MLTLLSVCPLFTFLFQLGDPRLHLSLVSGVFILLTTILSIISILVSLKEEKKLETSDIDNSVTQSTH